jgi:hypothetical protein
VLAPTALAQSVPGSGYGGVAGEIQGDVAGAGAGAGQLDVLPFTGLDLALVAGGGLMLLLVGVVAKRLGSQS